MGGLGTLFATEFGGAKPGEWALEILWGAMEGWPGFAQGEVRNGSTCHSIACGLEYEQHPDRSHNSNESIHPHSNRAE